MGPKSFRGSRETGPTHLKANKARFLPEVFISCKSLLGLSLPLSLLSTHSARHCTRVFLIFSSNFTSQFCGRGEAGITDNRGTTSSKRPSMAMTWRRWAERRKGYIVKITWFEAWESQGYQRARFDQR